MLIRLKCMILNDYFLFIMFDSRLFRFFSVFSWSDSFNPWMQTWNKHKIIKHWMLAHLLGCLHARILIFMCSQAKHLLLWIFLDETLIFNGFFCKQWHRGLQIVTWGLHRICQSLGLVSRGSQLVSIVLEIVILGHQRVPWSYQRLIRVYRVWAMAKGIAKAPKGLGRRLQSVIWGL